MPACAFFVDRESGFIYGPECDRTLAHLDNRMREALGFPADPNAWLFGWASEGGIAGGLAWNRPIEEILANVEAVPADHPAHEGLRRVFDWLVENFDWENNWGSSSKFTKRSMAKFRKSYRGAKS